MEEPLREDRTAWEGEMFRLLAENVKDYAIFIVDPNRHILIWSKGAERLLRFTEEEIVGDRCDRFFTPEDVQRGVPQRELEQALQTGRGEDDRWHVRKDGSRFWASGTVTPLRDEGGRLRGFAKIMRDRTELKRAEETARERERQLQLLTDHAPVFIAHCDAAGRYRFVNKPYAARFGLHPRDVVGKHLRDVLSDNVYAAIERYVDVVLAGERVEFEVEVPVGGSGPYIMRCAYDPEFGADGRVQGFTAAIVNVTEARRARSALRESEQRLRTLSDNLPRGAVYQILGNESGGRRFLYVSSGIELLFGVTPAEILADASALYGLVHEEDRPRLMELETVAGEQLCTFDCEFRSWTRSGGLLWIHCRSAPRRLSNGDTVWEGILLDVTDRRRAEEELRAADRRKDEFLATLAHELRNPLAPIRNGLQLIRLAGNDAAVSGQAQAMMERQLTQMVRLIDDLLDVSRITRGKLQLRKEQVELAGVVGVAVEGSRPLVEASSHHLTVTLPPDAIYVEADPTRLAQVFSNLLTNASKYTDQGGHIQLTAERHGDEVVVSVRDTGIGIAAEHLPRLFEMFTQVAPALERSQGGLGIGLSLVKGLVEMHGGSVEARSDGEGRGSEFVVRLPLSAHSHGPQESHLAGGEGDTNRPKRRILVADDNQDAADSLAMMLRLAGHEVHAAHDGQEAVEAARWFRPDVVLLDIGMPKLNGYEAARRIRESSGDRHVVLMAITGWAQEEDQRRAAEAGFDHHLTKPVDPAALEKLLTGPLVRPADPE